MCGPGRVVPPTTGPTGTYGGAKVGLMGALADSVLAAGGKVTADNSNRANPPSLALDGNLDTWWEAAPGQTTGTLTLALPKAVTFDVVSLQEAVDHRGQRIESFAIEA